MIRNVEEGGIQLGDVWCLSLWQSREFSSFSRASAVWYSLVRCTAARAVCCLAGDSALFRDALHRPSTYGVCGKLVSWAVRSSVAPRGRISTVQLMLVRDSEDSQMQKLVQTGHGDFSDRLLTMSNCIMTFRRSGSQRVTPSLSWPAGWSSFAVCKVDLAFQVPHRINSGCELPGRGRVGRTFRAAAGRRQSAGGSTAGGLGRAVRTCSRDVGWS